VSIRKSSDFSIEQARSRKPLDVPLSRTEVEWVFRIGPTRDNRFSGVFGSDSTRASFAMFASSRAGAEAKAGIVGRRCPPGGKEGVAEDSREPA
jgi:hypothetical protein